LKVLYNRFIRMAKTAIEEFCHDGLSRRFSAEALLSSD